jgi:Icc-related predicted phosphoesterase
LFNAPNDGVKTLVLAGDCVEAVLLKEKTHRRNEIVEFLLAMNDKYDCVIWVLGNHCHYENTFVYTVQNVRRRFKEIGLTNYHVLEKEIFEHEDAIFFGATMWTTFRSGNPLSMNDCQRGMSDYQQIYKSSMAYGEKIKLTPEDTAADCRRALMRLQDFIDTPTDKPKILVTHMAPSAMSLDPKYVNSWLKDAYYEDISEMLLDSDIKVAIHGHVHSPSDYMIGDCRVVCNPRGYYGHENSTVNYKFKTINI